MTPRFSVVPLFLLTLGVAGCDVQVANVNVCSGKQICISRGGGEQIVGSGTIRTETRAVGSFTSVRLEGAGRVVIESGETDGVTVSSDDNVLPEITTEVRGGMLILSTAAGTSITTHELFYRVTVRDLREIDASGAGGIEAAKLASKALTVTVTGASHLRLSGKVAELKLAISGAGSWTRPGSWLSARMSS
jgi:Putative auto-transporter adhesin, head GIN domain